MGGDSLSTLVNIKSIVKWDSTSYHYLCTKGAFNVFTARFNTCFNCDAPNHGVRSCPQNKDQKNIPDNKKISSGQRKTKVEMEEARHSPSAVTIRAGLINPKRNSEALRRQTKIPRLTMAFTLLKASGCASIIRVLGLIPHTPLDFMMFLHQCVK